MWDMNSINEENMWDPKQVQDYGAEVGFISVTDAKGSFENEEFTFRIPCESEIIIQHWSSLPPKATNLGTLS